MSSQFHATIDAGHLRGVASWDDTRQTFVSELTLFDGTGPFPPPATRLGTRFAEFSTVDALANGLAAIGLEVSGDSRAALDELAASVFGVRRRPEVVGLTIDGRRRLHLLTPAGYLVGFGLRLDHPDYQPWWGDASPATVETARTICERVWVRHPHADIEAFALGLTYEFLADAGDDFAIDAVALCDWFLTDTAIGSRLGSRTLSRLKGSSGVE